MQGCTIPSSASSDPRLILPKPWCCVQFACAQDTNWCELLATLLHSPGLYLEAGCRPALDLTGSGLDGRDSAHVPARLCPCLSRNSTDSLLPVAPPCMPVPSVLWVPSMLSFGSRIRSWSGALWRLILGIRRLSPPEFCKATHLSIHVRLPACCADLLVKGGQGAWCWLISCEGQGRTEAQPRGTDSR